MSGSSLQCEASFLIGKANYINYFASVELSKDFIIKDKETIYSSCLITVDTKIIFKDVAKSYNNILKVATSQCYLAVPEDQNPGGPPGEVELLW